MSLIKHDLPSQTLALSSCCDGYWLWDSTCGMNLAMRAKTEREAFVTALEYYQTRLAEVEKRDAALTKLVERFVEDFEKLNDED